MIDDSRIMPTVQVMFTFIRNSLEEYKKMESIYILQEEKAKNLKLFR
jgi:hypothetical protein